LDRSIKNTEQQLDHTCYCLFCGCKHWCAFHQSHGNMCNYMEPKIIFLRQKGIWTIFFVQLYRAGSHTEHHWRCSKPPANIQETLGQVLMGRNVFSKMHKKGFLITKFWIYLLKKNPQCFAFPKNNCQFVTKKRVGGFFGFFFSKFDKMAIFFWNTLPSFG
jgi:hypothetical protein